MSYLITGLNYLLLYCKIEQVFLQTLVQYNLVTIYVFALCSTEPVSRYSCELERVGGDATITYHTAEHHQGHSQCASEQQQRRAPPPGPMLTWCLHGTMPVMEMTTHSARGIAPQMVFSISGRCFSSITIGSKLHPCMPHVMCVGIQL